MRKRIITLICVAIIIIFFTSCSNVRYYQVFEIKPISVNAKVINDTIIYEDGNCSILYNFWNEGGNTGFVFYNKFDSNIYIDMSETFFIKNNVVTYDYYSKGICEKEILCVPPKTNRIISGVVLNKNIIPLCPLAISKKDIQNKNNEHIFLDKMSSPLVFYNLIVYSFDKSLENPISIKNDFFVHKIVNYREKDIVEFKLQQEPCDNSSIEYSGFNLIFSSDVEKANKFYVEYIFKKSTKTLFLN